MALSLFAPEKYGIATHNGYDITIYQDFYRSLCILKNRDGDSNIHVPLFFNGAADIFKEMPTLDDTEGLKAVSNLIQQIRTNNN